MTTTFDELILSAEAEAEDAQRRASKALATVKLLHSKARNEARGLTDDERADAGAAMAANERAQQSYKDAMAKVADLKEAKAAEERTSQLLAEKHEDTRTRAPKPAYDQVARVGNEERTYHPGQPGGPGVFFLNDVLRKFLHNDIDADMRLSRHMQEERVERGQYLVRATGTGSFAGLVVPQYLTELYAPQVSARRPFADAMTKLPLPEQGMTVNISRITTGSEVGLQSSQGTDVAEQDMDDTLLTENVQTAAGSQSISRQAIDRGLGIEAVTMQDLQRKYAVALDSTLLTQASTGLRSIATGITVDDTTPTVAELYPYILEAASASEVALLGEAQPDIVVMHPRRWNWFNAGMTAKWPLIGQPGIAASQAGVNYAARYGSGFRGLLPNGMAVIVDANVPTNLGSGENQDEIYVLPSEESYLWEDPNAPQFIRAEQSQVKKLLVDLVLYGYFAYTMRRYSNSHQKLAGTALVTPTFTTA